MGDSSINTEAKWHTSCGEAANYGDFGTDGANRPASPRDARQQAYPPGVMPRRTPSRTPMSTSRICNISTAPGHEGEHRLNARKPHILVVDDDASIRETRRDLLEDAGYTVAEARDGLLAMDYLRKAPNPVIVLLDLMMPRMDGAAVLGAVAGDSGRLRRHTYIMMTAGHQTLSLAFAHLLSDLEVQVIYKPFDIDRMLDLIASQRV